MVDFVDLVRGSGMPVIDGVQIEVDPVTAPMKLVITGKAALKAPFTLYFPKGMKRLMSIQNFTDYAITLKVKDEINGLAPVVHHNVQGLYYCTGSTVVAYAGTFGTYQYSQTYDLVNVNLANQNVPDTGDGLDFTLLADQEVPGGIIANQDFWTLYEGYILVDSSLGCEIDFELGFIHKFGSPQVAFRSTRPYRFRVQVNGEWTIPLPVFNSIAKVPLGTFNTQDGTEITVTQRDLDQPINIELEARIKAFQTANLSNRVSTTLAIRGFQGKIHFRQFAVT